MKCLITGVTGFVGHYLAELLLSEGYSVSGTYLNEREVDSLFSLKERVIFYRADILDFRQVSTAISKTNPDFILHLAAQSSVALSFKNPELTMKVNVEGTKNVLRAAPKDSKVLVTCSSDEYGKVPEEDMPLKEEHLLTPVSPYAESKMLAEKAALSMPNALVTRSFNHTGPGQSTDFVCSDWARQIVEIERGRREVIRVGNVSIRRDFSDVRDVVRAYLLLCRKGKPREVYNVCSGNAYPLSEILEILTSLSRVKVKVAIDPARFRPSDNPVYVGDNSKIRQLGWEPKIPIEKTLSDLISYWRAQNI